MAVKYWSGAGADDKFSTAGNWTGGLPGTGDTAIINATSDNIVSETYATAFAELRISDGFTGTIGVEPLPESGAIGTVTITDYTELNTGDKVNLIASDGTNYDFVNGDQSSVLGTWESDSSNGGTATNLMNVINTSSGPAGTRFTATVDGAVVTITQATAGADGNRAITLTDSGTVGMTKTDFAGGAAGVALTVTATTVVIDCAVKVYLNTTSTLVMVERTASGDDAVRLTGTIATLRVLDARGTIVLGEAAALAVSDLEFLGGRFATVEVQATTTLAAAPVSMNEGALKIYGMAVAATGTWDLIGGVVELHAGDYTTATFEIWNTARVLDKRDANSTIATVNMYGGNWDGTTSTADLLIIGALKLYGDASFDERNGLLNYQYTTGVTFAGEGTFRPATARELSQG